MKHIYKTEGSDRKHGALRMIGMCSCGWSGEVLEGQGPESQEKAKAQWQNHVEIATEIQGAALAENESQRGVKL